MVALLDGALCLEYERFLQILFFADVLDANPRLGCLTTGSRPYQVVT